MFSAHNKNGSSTSNISHLILIEKGESVLFLHRYANAYLYCIQLGTPLPYAIAGVKKWQ